VAAVGRDAKGRFAPGAGNTGRPKGTVNVQKREFAALCREALAHCMGPHAKALFSPLLDYDAKVLSVRQRFVEYLADRGFGQVPREIDDSEKTETIEGMLDAIREARNMESGEAKEAGTAVGRPVQPDDDDDD
jgi:hypothetical protein